VVAAAAGAAGAAAAGVEAAEARAVATSLLKEELGAIKARERPRLRRGVSTRRGRGRPMSGHPLGHSRTRLCG
jgi:hypothetical protein